MILFTVQEGYRGFVTGIVNADHRQRVIVDVRRDNDQPLASATFEAQGVMAPIRNLLNGQEHWSFGPFDSPATVLVTISSNPGGGAWHPSKMIGPLAVQKQPEPDYPMSFVVHTIASEDHADASHDDCTLQVLQYK